ncbi:hypothetical protein DFH08DRAFT_887776, partial [Mycena albidolilacea]
MGLKTWVASCDAILADLHLRENNLFAAKSLFEQSLKVALRAPEIKSFCLERLGNASHWGPVNSSLEWTTVFLVDSLKFKVKLGVYKALQFFGDIFLSLKDEHTATSLFTIALEGFTYMDVHRSRAECMQKLGDLFQRNGTFLKAVELWTTARPLFERALQVKQIENIDEKLVCIGDVQCQYKESLAHLETDNVPSLEDRLSRHQEQVDYSIRPRL